MNKLFLFLFMLSTALFGQEVKFLVQLNEVEYQLVKRVGRERFQYGAEKSFVCPGASHFEWLSKQELGLSIDRIAIVRGYDNPCGYLRTRKIYEGETIVSSSDPKSTEQEKVFRQINFLPILQQIGKKKIPLGEVALVFLDSGVNCHEDLIERFDPLFIKDCIDIDGHGTAVVGAGSAKSHNHIGIIGISQQAPIISIRVNKGREGGLSFTDEIEALRAITSLHHLPYRRLIVNMSFAIWENKSDQKRFDVWGEVLESLKHKAFFVAGSGNNPNQNTKEIQPCASSHLENVVCVAGVDEKDSFFSTGSSRGEEVSISAPWCAFTTVEKNGYSNKCGTSISTPLVANAATLILEEAIGEGLDPSPKEIKKALVLGSRFSPSLLGGTLNPGILDIATSYNLLLLKEEVEKLDRPETSGITDFENGPYMLGRGKNIIVWGYNLKDAHIFLNGTPIEATFASNAQIVFKMPTSIFVLRESGNILSLIKKDSKGRFLPDTAKTILKNFSAR